MSFSQARHTTAFRLTIIWVNVDAFQTIYLRTNSSKWANANFAELPAQSFGQYDIYIQGKANLAALTGDFKTVTTAKSQDCCQPFYCSCTDKRPTPERKLAILRCWLGFRPSWQCRPSLPWVPLFQGLSCFFLAWRRAEKETENEAFVCGKFSPVNNFLSFTSLMIPEVPKETILCLIVLTALWLGNDWTWNWIM